MLFLMAALLFHPMALGEEFPHRPGAAVGVSQDDPYGWWSSNAGRVYDLVLQKQREGMDKAVRAHYRWVVNVAVLPTQMSEDFPLKETFIRLLKTTDEEIQVLLIQPHPESIAAQLTVLLAEEPEASLEEWVGRLNFTVDRLEMEDCPQVFDQADTVPGLSIPLVEEETIIFLEATEYRIDSRSMNSDIRLVLHGARSLAPAAQENPMLKWIASLRQAALDCR